MYDVDLFGKRGLEAISVGVPLRPSLLYGVRVVVWSQVGSKSLLTAVICTQAYPASSSQRSKVFYARRVRLEAGLAVMLPL